ncbi:MAG: DoxX family protein [bacterium]|nr:DoxX family protein [bacterium]
MLDKTLAPHGGRAYVLLRFVVGLLFAMHGVQKVFGYLADAPKEMFTQIWIGGVIELATGALVAVGLFTRWAAFLASGTMAVAYFQFHWPFVFDQSAWPIVNEGELAVVYCFLFLYIACQGNWAGPGKKKGD